MYMQKNQFIPYEIAKQVTDLGFDDHCFGYYRRGLLQLFDKRNITSSIQDLSITSYTKAPLYSQVIDWLRDEHKIHIAIGRNYDDWCYFITEFKNGNKHIKGGSEEISDYYQALTKAIEEALNLIKNK